MKETYLKIEMFYNDDAAHLSLISLSDSEYVDYLDYYGDRDIILIPISDVEMALKRTVEVPYNEEGRLIK